MHDDLAFVAAATQDDCEVVFQCCVWCRFVFVCVCVHSAVFSSVHCSWPCEWCTVDWFHIIISGQQFVTRDRTKITQQYTHFGDTIYTSLILNAGWGRFRRSQPGVSDAPGILCCSKAARRRMVLSCDGLVAVCDARAH